VLALDGAATVETVELPTAKRGRVENLRPFQPGQSGNPRGRPKKDIDLAALAQKHAEQAVLTLVDVMSNEEAPPSARVSAAAEILDRGFGRAPASLDVNHKLGISEEFEQFIRQLTGRPSKVIEAQVEEISNGSQETRGRHLASEPE
jgi:hypothetical protein